MMSGKTESVAKHLELLKESVDDFISKVGLGNLHPPDKIHEYLSLTREQLNALTDEGCGEIAYILSRYTVWLQLEENRLSAQLNWAKSTLDALVLPRVHNYEGYGLAEKRAKAEAESESAQALIKVRISIQSLLDSIKFVASKVNDMSQILMGLQATKRNKNYR